MRMVGKQLLIEEESYEHKEIGKGTVAAIPKNSYFKIGDTILFKKKRSQQIDLNSRLYTLITDREIILKF